MLNDPDYEGQDNDADDESLFSSSDFVNVTTRWIIDLYILKKLIRVLRSKSCVIFFFTLKNKSSRKINPIGIHFTVI